MDWNTYYSRFHDWEESTQLRHLSTVTEFGPSSEVCELACEFYEEASADRLIRKAMKHGVRFTAAEVLELDGVVSRALMVPLIKTVSHPLTAGELDDFSFWLSREELRTLAQEHGIPLDGDSYVLLPEMEEAEREWQEAKAEAEAERREEEQARRETEERDLILARWLLAVVRRRRRERRKKRRER